MTELIVKLESDTWMLIFDKKAGNVDIHRGVGRPINPAYTMYGSEAPRLVDYIRTHGLDTGNFVSLRIRGYIERGLLMIEGRL